MRASLNSLNKIGGQLSDLPVDQLLEKIGVQLGGIEEVIEFGKQFEGALIVKVVSCQKHPDADRLSVCKIDDAKAADDVERDGDGLVQVVCGAPNVKEGMKAVWLPPGSIVPSSYTKDPFVLEAREIRGVVSNGMLASGQELGLSDDHSGIVELEADQKPGNSFAETFSLKDEVVIDIENKMFTHRPDCFGWLGVARETAGIQAKKFSSPDWYVVNPSEPKQRADDLKLDIKNEVPELVPRFTAITFRDVKVSPSPVWLQIELAKAGIRPINNVVDVTNYYMVLTGQPLHAYGYDKVMTQDEGADKATIIIRKPRQDEKLKLINGKEIEPHKDTIMIASRDRLIGVGGVMGGADTEVDEKTTNVILEVANFDMYSIRRTSMTHGLFTDAVTRFSKGQSPLQTKAVLVKAAEEICQIAEAKIASQIIDDIHVDLPGGDKPNHWTLVDIETDFINSRLGLSLTAKEIAGLLENVEFETYISGEKIKAYVPFWRTDIEIAEDIVEEVGRLYGFDRLPKELPRRTMNPVSPDSMLSFKSEVRRRLASLGANEVYTYSFVHGELMKKTGQNPDSAFKLSNALSPELQYYRMSLTPSLLAHVHQNIKAGYDRFAIYELGKAHNKLHRDDDNGVPKEYEMLSLVYADTNKKAKPAYFQARAYLDELARSQGLTVEYRIVEKEADIPVAKPFDYKRSALVFAAGTDTVLGIIGEYKSSVRNALKLPVTAAGFEIGLQELKASSRPESIYRPLSRYPSLTQDICLQVPSEVSYGELAKQFKASLNSKTPLDQIAECRPVDIYESKDLSGQKRITFRVQLQSYERTLTDEVLSNRLAEIAAVLSESLGAKQI